MSRLNEFLRFWWSYIALAAGLIWMAVRLSMLHLDLVTTRPKGNNYVFTRDLLGLRGNICAAAGPAYPLACSMMEWEYRLDPKALNRKQYSYTEAAKLIAETLGLPQIKVMDAFARRGDGSRNVFLAASDNTEIHNTLARKASHLGLKISDRHVRRYPQGRRLSQVVGFVNHDPTNSMGGAGIEQRYETLLKGRPGLVKGTKSAVGRELRLRRGVDVDPETGCMVQLTVDHNLQYEVEKALAAGIVSNGAEAAWSIILSVKTGGVLAMASLPDYEPENFNRFTADAKKNRCIAECYEPGSVMKCITACAALNEGIYGPDSLISSAHNDPRYYRLPTDHGHKWDAFMTVRDAIVHSSNIIFGKIGADVGAKKLRRYMDEFGLGRRTGIELPGEERGLVPWNWDKVKCTRAPIGQGIAITAIQLAAAYNAIANDGEVVRPYIVEKVTAPDGQVIERHGREVVGRACRPDVARKVREMMLGVARKGGTARRAAVRGYTVAGKTGTAQIPYPGSGYSSTDYHASFIGIVPATKPEVVILVTYRKPVYCRRRGERYEIFNHQGGTCAAPTFRRIAEQTMRYLEVEPDCPEQIPDEDE